MFLEKVERVQRGESPPFRPSLDLIPSKEGNDYVKKCLEDCWNEDPEKRPDFKQIRDQLKPMKKDM